MPRKLTKKLIDNHYDFEFGSKIGADLENKGLCQFLCIA